jgi:hypothetical protein
MRDVTLVFSLTVEKSLRGIIPNTKVVTNMPSVTIS